ncbi:MAG: hypothetical protein AB7H90_19450 [Alphaproteobacteria bacterium]
MTPDRQSPLPGSPEAHAQGCTCPDPGGAAQTAGREIDIDRDCPVHGRAAIAWDRDSERGPIDTEGDIADKASEPALRRNR